jgi:hypothetical protein
VLDSWRSVPICLGLRLLRWASASATPTRLRVVACEFIPSDRILALAAAVRKHNPELDDAEATSADVNSFGVIETKFSLKSHLYSLEDAFHVRRKPSRCL